MSDQDLKELPSAETLDTDAPRAFEESVDPRAQERRGWLITSAGVIVIILATTLLTIAINAAKGGDDEDLATGASFRTYRATQRALMTVEGSRQEISSSITQVDLARDRTRTTATITLNGQSLEFEVITDGDSLYARLPDLFYGGAGKAPGTAWVRADGAGGITAQGLQFGFIPLPDDIGNLLTTLESDTATTTPVGTEEIRGRTVAVQDMEISVSGLYADMADEATLAGMVSVLGETLPIRVWLGDDGLVHRLRIRLGSLPGFSAPTITILTDLEYDVAVDIRIPSPSEVSDAPPEIAEQFGGSAPEGTSDAPDAEPGNESEPESSGAPDPQSSAAPEPQPSGVSSTFTQTGRCIQGETATDCPGD